MTYRRRLEERFPHVNPNTTVTFGDLFGIANMLDQGQTPRATVQGKAESHRCEHSTQDKWIDVHGVLHCDECEFKPTKGTNPIANMVEAWAEPEFEAKPSDDKQTPGTTAYDAWVNLPETRRLIDERSIRGGDWQSLSKLERQEWETIGNAVVDRHGVIEDAYKPVAGIIADRRSIMFVRNQDGHCMFRIEVHAPPGNPHENGAEKKFAQLDTIARMLGLDFDDEPNVPASTPENDAISSSDAQWKITLAQKDEKIAELERELKGYDRAAVQARKALFDCGIEAQLPDGIREMGKRIKNLERVNVLEGKIAELEQDQRRCVDAMSESNLVPPGRTLVEGISELVKLHETAAKKIAELEKRLAEQSAPPVVDGQASGKELRSVIRSFTAIVPQYAPEWESLSAPAQDDWHQAAKAFIQKVACQPTPIIDGKTPGQVNRDAYYGLLEGPTNVDAYEFAAKAVLDTFGKRATREALERVRLAVLVALDNAATSAAFDSSIAQIIDAELAKLGTDKPTSE